MLNALSPFADLMASDGTIPRPQWQIVHNHVANIAQLDQHPDVWTAAARQWLQSLVDTFGAPYELYESEHFLLLSAYEQSAARPLLRHCEACRTALIALLPGIAEFQAPGKVPVLHFAHPETYYTYVDYFYADGEYGASVGVYLHDEYSHLALRGWGDHMLTIAHELMHAAVHHRELPMWIEEGLTQLFECDAGGRTALLVTPEIAKKHKAYWRREGLTAFWLGQSFSLPDDGQEVSYELAEILMRLLIEEHRPRWLGWDRRPLEQFHAFLQAANAGDFGQTAAREHLGFGIDELAGRFLGQGDWLPPPGASAAERSV